MPFKKATKRAVPLRAALDGPTGSGKTITALKIMRGLVGPAGRIAVIDTEHGTSEKFYANVTDFDMAALTQYQPRDYIGLIQQAHDYDGLIIDSLSHAWDGVLEMVDSKGGRFDAWKDVTPHHKALVNALLTYPGHLIVTMRTKMAYEVTKDTHGRTTVAKLGLKPVQREGLEYEFDLVMDMDQAHRLTVSKSRMSELADRTVVMPDEDFGVEIARCVSDGEPVPEPTRAERIAAGENPVVVLREEYPDLTDGMSDDQIKDRIRGMGYTRVNQIRDAASALLIAFGAFDESTSDDADPESDVDSEVRALFDAEVEA